MKPGGRFFTRMTGPDGFDYSGTACILEVVSGERIVWSSTMKDGYRPNEFTGRRLQRLPVHRNPHLRRRR